MGTAELDKVISFLLNVIFIPLLIALYRGYKSMRAEVTKTTTILKVTRESLEKIEERQYDRRNRVDYVEDEKRIHDRRRK